MPGVPERDVRPAPLRDDETAVWEARLEAVLADAPADIDTAGVESTVRCLLTVLSPTVDEVLRAQLLASRLLETWPAGAALLKDAAKRRNGEIGSCPPWLV